jgi:hypothetical protein
MWRTHQTTQKEEIGNRRRISLLLGSNPLALSPDEISEAMNNSTPSLIISRINFKVALGCARCKYVKIGFYLLPSTAVELLLIKSTNFTVCN